MSAEIKRILPLQTDDKEFDNFFGLKFGELMRKCCFIMLSYGFNVAKVYRKRKSIHVFFEPDNIFLLDIKIQKVILSFEPYKGYYVFVRSSIIIENDEESVKEKIIPEIQKLPQKFNLVNKKESLIENKSKRFFTLDESKLGLWLIFSERHASDFGLDIEFSFSNWFCSTSGEGCKYKSNSFTSILENANFGLNDIELKDEQLYQQSAFVIGVLEALSYAELTEFVDFWEIKTHAKFLPDLAKKIQEIFKLPRENVDIQKIRDEIKHTVEGMQSEILEETKKKNANKKTENQNVEEMKLQKLREALADL